MRIVFAGTPDFAASHLQALIDEGVNIVAVYSQPDRPAGRGKKLKASEVKELALANNLPVIQPASLKDESTQQSLADLKPDLMIVVAYGLILPKKVLDIPTHGCINVHGSILPKWRGAAPIQRAIWAGDKQTGVTIMQMDEGLDTGDILSIETLDIMPDDTSANLYAKLAELGPKALTYYVVNRSQFTATKQDDNQATYAAKLSKEEAYLNWELPAKSLEQCVRAFNPWPVSWFKHNDKAIKVFKSHIESESAQATPGEIISYDKNGLRIATSNGSLCITNLQLAGKKAQDVSQLVNGQPTLFEVGTILN